MLNKGLYFQGDRGFSTPPSPQPLPRSFFERPTVQVAKDLLGKFLFKETKTGVITTRIIDVEAYVGPEDRACHASRGRTKRTEVMFGPAGVTYVYLIYGMYHCLNLVTEGVDYPAAVLIRGIEVVEDGTQISETPNRILGPGRVCRFLEIDRSLNGIDATQGHMIWVEDRQDRIKPKEIQALTRIGVEYAGEWAKKPWRFCFQEVSRSGKAKGHNTRKVGTKT